MSTYGAGVVVVSGDTLPEHGSSMLPWMYAICVSTGSDAKSITVPFGKHTSCAAARAARHARPTWVGGRGKLVVVAVCFLKNHYGQTYNGTVKSNRPIKQASMHTEGQTMRSMRSGHGALGFGRDKMRFCFPPSPTHNEIKNNPTWQRLGLYAPAQACALCMRGNARKQRRSVGDAPRKRLIPLSVFFPRTKMAAIKNNFYSAKNPQASVPLIVPCISKSITIIL
jgi:hypothetical protein